MISFTEDAGGALADRSGEAVARLRSLAAEPVIPLADETEHGRLFALGAELFDEQGLAREGYRLAMRGLLVLIAVAVARLAASRARTGSITLRPADATVAQLRALLDEFFHKERLLGFYAEKLGMTVDRLNDHVKRATGVTAGHLIRQRVLERSQTPACVHHAANPRHCQGARVRRSVAFRAVLPQTDRYDTARIPRAAGRLTASRGTLE